MKLQSRPRGIVLLFVLGILSLLSIVMVAFVQMSRLERSISRNYVDNTRALLAAESGIEYAISRVEGFSGGPLRAAETADMQFLPAPTSPDDPLKSFRASFQTPNSAGPRSGDVANTYGPASDYFVLHVSDEAGKLNLNDSNGTWNLDTDPHADPDDDDDLVNAPGRLEKLVEALGDAIFGPPVGLNISSYLFSADPDFRYSRPNLPGQQFTSLDQVREALVFGYPDLGLPPALSTADWERFAPHVTLWNWQDPDVLRPTWQVDIHEPNPLASYPNLGFDIYLYSDFQTRWFELEPRSPVNVNTASVELLQALVAPVRGWFLREGPGERVSNGRYGSWNCAPLYFDWRDQETTGNAGPWPNGGSLFGKNNILGMARETLAVADPKGLAQAMYDRVHGADPVDPSDDKPFGTWEEFEYFLRHEIDPALILTDAMLGDLVDDTAEQRGQSLGPGVTAADLSARRALTDPPMSIFLAMPAMDGTIISNVGQAVSSDTFQITASAQREAWWLDHFYQIHIDALLANFNPNSRLGDYTPSRRMRGAVDKAHLTSYTTELCFEPTGSFRIDSVGVITDATGTLLSRSDISAVVRVFEFLRRTTQRHFMEDAKLDEVFTTHEAILPTAHAMLAAGFNGFTLESHPEPFNDSTGNTVLNFDTGKTSWSRFDGSLSLATWQSPETVTAPADATLTAFVQSFNGMLDPKSYYISPGMWKRGSEGYPLHKLNNPDAHPLTERFESAGDFTIPGNLYPEGAYSEAGRIVTFPVVHSADPAPAGALSFWVRPNFDPGITSRIHKLTTLHATLQEPAWPYPDDVRQPVYMREFTLMYFCHDTGKNLPADATVFHGKRNDDALGSPTAPGEVGDSWIAPRSMVVGFGAMGVPTDVLPPSVDGTGSTANTYEPNVWTRATTSINHNYPLPAGAAANYGVAPPDQAYHFEGWCWNHIAIGWDFNYHPDLLDATYAAQVAIAQIFGAPIPPPPSSAVPNDKITMAINGITVPDTLAWKHPAPKGEVFVDLQNAYNTSVDVNAYVRLGEVTNRDKTHSWGPIAGQTEAYSADCLYDEIVMYPTFEPMLTLATEMDFGRYYNDDPEKAVFTSPAFDAHKLLGASRTTTLHLRSMSWTTYWPENNRGALGKLVANVNGVDVNPTAADPMQDHWNGGLVAGDPDGWDPVSVDYCVVATDGTPGPWQFTDAAATLAEAKKQMPACATGVNVRTALKAAGIDPIAGTRIHAGETLQFRVHFNYEPDGSPLYESPVFDDITFTFLLPRARILSWRIKQ